jgi:hypothetical protein
MEKYTRSLSVKKFPVLFLVLCAVLVCRCKEKTVETPQARPVAQKEPKPVSIPVPFVPPADSIISAEQMKSWSGCNPLLDSLTYRYADSFKTEDPAAFLRYQDDFITAQNKICVRAGLPGGYDEYKWILQNMGIAKNRTVLQSVHAQMF